jgi:uncharacterized phage protein (TIGR02216 family)
MVQDDPWDWPLLFYVGTVLLQMTPSYFWRCTPRKLSLLIAQHLEINNTQKKEELAYVDQIL